MTAKAETASEMAPSHVSETEANFAVSEQSNAKLEGEPRSGPTTRVASMAEVTPENFREVALTVLGEEMKAWQGPAQYCAPSLQQQKRERNSAKT